MNWRAILKWLALRLLIYVWVAVGAAAVFFAAAVVQALVAAMESIP